MSASIVLVVIAAFALGYLFVSWCMKPKREAGDLRATNEAGSQNHNYADQENRSAAQEDTSTYAPAPPQRNKEREYGRLLGLNGVVTKKEVRTKYLEAVAKYHPDKVNHLAPEFQAMAEEKTKALTEAYEYFRIKYDLR